MTPTSILRAALAENAVETPLMSAIMDSYERLSKIAASLSADHIPDASNKVSAQDGGEVPLAWASGSNVCTADHIQGTRSAENPGDWCAADGVDCDFVAAWNDAAAAIRSHAPGLDVLGER